MKTKLLVMLLAIALAAGVAQANMLVNSSFEDGAFGVNYSPDFWEHYYTSYPDPVHTWVSNAGEAHSGNKYVKMYNWLVSYTTWTTSAYLGQSGVVVKEGKDYTFSVWAKTGVEGRTNLAGLNLEWLDSIDNWISSNFIYIPVADANWIEVDFGALTAPKGAATATVWLIAPLENGLNPINYDDAAMLGPDPNITAGPDMISWDGETLSLTGTTTNTPSTITWSAEPDYGAVITDGDTLTPTVEVDCIIPSGPATIENHSFENGLDSWEIATGEGHGTWNGVGDTPDANGVTIYITPTDGRQCAYVDGVDEAGALSQVLVHTLAANTTYTLTVDVGNDGYYQEDVAYRVQLRAGGSILAQDNDTHALDTYGVWATSTVTYDSGATPAQLGEPIEIRLIAKTGTAQMNFDNVVLTANPPFPAYVPDVLPIKLTLDIDGKYDTMKIDVYPDACAAWLAAGLRETTDLVDDTCITNLADLAEMVKTRTDHNALTAPMAKEEPESGKVLYERWTGSGTADSMLTESSEPDYTEMLTSSEWGVGDDNSLSNYRGRITAWLTPPVTGNYTFWICTDDNGRLWLSTDHNPANARLVASVPGWAGQNNWTKFPEQKSENISLQGGKTYWLRGGYQEGGGGDHIQIAWSSSEAGFADHTIIEGQYLSGDPSPPTPADGDFVYTGNVDLGWTNIDPNKPGDPVWVDVWFGTDPNDYNDFNKILDATTPAGEDANSVTADASTPGTYYWQVNSYIYGDPSVVVYDDNDLNPDTFPIIEGSIWSFIAVTDVPVSVDAGDDWITWSGQPVQLDASIDDDAVSASTIEWSADPADGVVFDPNEFVEDPTVTIIKVPGVTEIEIINPGFEDPPYADGDWDYGLPAPWRDGYYWGNDDWVDDPYSAGIENPAPGYAYFGIVPEGENAAFQESYYSDTYGGYDMGLRQILAATLQPDVNYELSVMVGNPHEFASNDYLIELLAGGVVLNKSTGPSPDPNTWTASPVTVTYDSLSTVAAGRALEIRLVMVDDGSNDQVLNFDDVKLTATGGTYPKVVTLTASVSDDVSSDEDTLTIDVYDTPCIAAIDPGDFDADCDTDLEDYAALAEEWLVYNELTTSVVKP